VRHADRLTGPLKLVVLPTVVAVTALGAVSVLGVAAAEAPTTPTTTAAVAAPVRTVSVQGVANEAIEQSANASTATAVYRQGMADAIVDGQSKAQFLASKAGATLGAVQSIGEGGGYISCPSEVEYLGEQPDFGSGGVVAAPVSARSVARRAAPVVHKPAAKKHRKQSKAAPVAKRAAASGCTLSAQVSLVYALS
jgi:uncharacterized protein YggE